ncbi:MAG: UDP-N-acetylmuramate--L-alanine ligase [Petrotogales bacterium]
MKYHFIGIGGIGMSGLALHLAAEGNEVYGSNVEVNERVEYLKEKGIDVFSSHSGKNWKDPDAIIKTTAIPQGNPELEKAFSEFVPAYYRMEMLKKVISSYENSLCVTGTDGKTTTTALLSKIFIDAKKNPTVLLGGLSPHLSQGNYHRGSKDTIITELDESDGFFASFIPQHAVVTNVRHDHLEHYVSSERNLINHFAYFGKKIKGTLVHNADDPNSRKAFGNGGITFGKHKGKYTFKNRKAGLIQSFDVYKDGELLGNFSVGLPGEHNAYNATAAIALAVELGIGIKDIQESLISYISVDRRFSIRGIDKSRDLYLIDDYAHTPEEIRTTIMGTRESYPESEILVVFQPHRYSRLARENGRFANSLKEADAVCVYKLYDAYEKGMYALDETEVLKGLHLHGVPAYHATDYDKVLKWIDSKKRSVILFLGAGDITRIAHLSVSRFCPVG